MSIVNDVLECTDEILGLRDDLGAIKHKVYIVTRTWSGSELGEGSVTESFEQIKPTPWIVNFKRQIRLREAGKAKQGDIVLKHISKESYKESDLRTVTANGKVEKYYVINSEYYELIDIEEDYVYFNVIIRKRSRK